MPRVPAHPAPRRAVTHSTAAAPPVTRDALVVRLKEAKARLAESYRIRSLGLFGSYARGTASRRSDIDILVSFKEAPTLFTFVRLKRELERALGRRVDLVMREALRPSIGRRIVAEVTEV